MQATADNMLLAAAALCGLAALAHIGCIVFGGDWYRFFGAGEQMAQMSEQGLWYPAMVTSVIVIALLICASYALAAAGVMRRLPFMRLALLAITCVFLLRAVAFVGLMPLFPENSLTFWWLSSGICLLIGGLFATGTYQRWSALARRSEGTL